MTLVELLARCETQLKDTPIITIASLLQFLRESIIRVCHRSLAITKYAIILVKANTARYFLPGDHIYTLGAYYDNSILGRANSLDIHSISISDVAYYHEDEWNDQASTSANEFIKQFAFHELWLIQLAHSQSSRGRKTITLVMAPVVDGDYVSTPGGLGGTITYTTANAYTLGAFDIRPSDGNLLIIYRAVDELPEATDQEITYNNILGIAYFAATLSLAISREDDEYDRYRSWLYSWISDAICTQLKSMTLVTGLRS